MKKILRRLKKAPKAIRIIFFIVCLGYVISYFFFAKSIIQLTGIETLIRYVILGLFLIYFIFYILKSLIKIVKRKYGLFIFLSFISLICIVLFSFCAFFIDGIFSELTGFSEEDSVVYSSYLISMKDTKITSSSVLGMISDEDDLEGNKLAKKLIKKEKLKNEISNYDDYLTMLDDLYSGNIDGAFVSGVYDVVFSSEETFENISQDTKIVYKYSEKMKNVDSKLANSNKSLKEPFTVLVLGVDSAADGLNANAAFNGDTLILMTVNPKTLNATMFSIPRDTYVPIACKKNQEAKINSSAAYGTSCVISTIEQLTDIPIDYYVKINFAGVVDLVNVLDGVDVDVEEPDYNINHGHHCNGVVCEQNSKRQWGEHTIYIKPGFQTLNGEEALAYSRCRGLYIESDLARNRHQQEVIEAVAKKLVSNISYSQFKNVLNAISDNIATNMSTDQILSSYNMLKDMLLNNLEGEEFINIQKSYLEIYSLPVVVPRTGRITSALGYYKGSLDDITKNMKVNLELEKPTIEKTFSYSIEENYEGKIAGKGKRTGATSETLENFRGQTRETAESYCTNKNLNCTFTYVDSNSQYYDANIAIDKITSSNPAPKSNLKTVSSVTFYINS